MYYKFYNEIKDKLIKNEVSKKVREYYNNKNDLSTYYEVGKLLSLAGKHYGDGIIKEYSIKLSNELNKKYDISTLFKMRKFYVLFGYKKVAPVVPQLSWSHYLKLLSFKDINEMNYYLNQCIKFNYSKRALERIIKNRAYQRLPNKTKNKLINQRSLEIIDLVKEPIILNKKHDYDKISEYALKEIIINDLDNFLLQLGDGFSYIGNEYKIKLGDRYNYIDLLLFNIKYNCYVIVELKNKI